MRSSRAFPSRLWLRSRQKLLDFPAFELSDFRISEIRKKQQKAFFGLRGEIVKFRNSKFQISSVETFELSEMCQRRRAILPDATPNAGTGCKHPLCCAFLCELGSTETTPEPPTRDQRHMRSHRVCSAGLALLAQRLLGCRFLSKWAHRLISAARIACLARRSRRLRDSLLPARKVCLIPRARGPERPPACTIRLG